MSGENPEPEECDECAEAVTSLYTCPECGGNFCVDCIDDHDCDVAEDY